MFRRDVFITYSVGFIISGAIIGIVNNILLTKLCIVLLTVL